ncbi:MAG: 5'/3'-nucleotidase SurE [Anaerolineae bacterium]
MDNPIILITNDDGIDSAGLRAAVEALLPVGTVIVAAPDRQWSGAGRSMPRDVTGKVREVAYPLSDQSHIRAYEIDASPALCVITAMSRLAPRLPDLVVAGINFGENVSSEITISGTIGAALEGAAFGLPALAVSVEMPVEAHIAGDAGEDYAASKAFTRRFAERLLMHTLPFDVDVLSINVPRNATPDTPWRLTRLSRHRYFVPVDVNRAENPDEPGYRVRDNPEEAEIGSDVWCLRSLNQISVTPLSLDMTSRVDFGDLDERLRGER